MRVYHIERDYSKTAQQQRKELEKRYINFNYLYADRGKLHFIAEGEKEEKTVTE